MATTTVLRRAAEAARTEREAALTRPRAFALWLCLLLLYLLLLPAAAEVQDAGARQAQAGTAAARPVGPPRRS